MDQLDPPAGVVNVVASAFPLDPASTVTGALESLPRPDLDPFERLALVFLGGVHPNSARAAATRPLMILTG